jgi:hypothetical protein
LGYDSQVSLSKKLNLGPAMLLRVIGRPKDVELGDVATTSAKKCEALMLFARNVRELEAQLELVVDFAKADKLTWVAYPKAKQLDTDLNRDILWQRLHEHGIDGVRQVAIDDVWSALRFRPAKA